MSHELNSGSLLDDYFHGPEISSIPCISQLFEIEWDIDRRSQEAKIRMDG